MKRWYVIHTKPRGERIAEENLQRQGYVTYLPRFDPPHERARTRVAAPEPLFPRYLFVHVDVERENISPIRSTFGVSTIVMFGGRLGIVSEDVIKVIRQGTDSQSHPHRLPRVSLQKGDPVTVSSGPFEGLQGIFYMWSGNDRVLILLDILGKTSKVNIGRNDIAGVEAIS